MVINKHHPGFPSAIIDFAKGEELNLVKVNFICLGRGGETVEVEFFTYAGKNEKALIKKAIFCNKCDWWSFI